MIIKYPTPKYCVWLKRSGEPLFVFRMNARRRRVLIWSEDNPVRPYVKALIDAAART